MWRVNGTTIRMSEGDYGIALPVTVSGVTLGSADSILYTFKDGKNKNVLLTKSFDAIVTQGTASGGGGSSPTLLGTLAVGAVSTNSTTDTDTGKSITVKGIYGYDLLICQCSVDTKTNGRHVVSTRLCWLTASSAIATKNGASFATATWNVKLSSGGAATSRSNTTPYGVYAKAATISAGSTGDNGQAVITIYQRYNSTQTGTINGSYTMRVYGVKLYDLA